MAQPLPTITKAPNGLDKVLNQPEEPRDSGFFANDSKHTSMNSTSALTPSSGGYQSSPIDHTPSPIATNIEPAGLPLASPASAMSVASMVSPTSAEHAIGRQHEGGYDSIRSSGGYVNGDARRESVGSSVYQNLGDLRLGAGSPYTSQNPSTTSLQETLQQQRNPGAGERPGFSRFSNSYQPSSARTPEVNGPYARKAPAITGPAPGSIARAAEATKGQAWAFPEVEVQRIPSAVRPSADNGPGTGYEDSRRSSLASVSSSQYTTECRYPLSQRRLEDGMPADFNHLSRASSEFQGPSQQHHHHQLTRLQSEEASSPTGSSQPYSRTPELRVTHKLAERKRRTEMKELFERLAAKLPSDGRSTKSSKWETLSKAIAEIDRTQSIINNQQSQLATQGTQIQSLQGQVDHLRAQLSGHPHHANGSSHPPNGAIPPMSVPASREAAQFPPYSWAPAQASAAPPKAAPARINGQRPDQRVELPSIRSLNPTYGGPQPMTGLEYPVNGSGSFGTAEQTRHQF